MEGAGPLPGEAYRAAGTGRWTSPAAGIETVKDFVERNLISGAQSQRQKPELQKPLTATVVKGVFQVGRPPFSNPAVLDVVSLNIREKNFPFPTDSGSSMKILDVHWHQ
jgi:hypothetical protein